MKFDKLPDDKSPDYYDILRKNCIKAYSKLLNNSKALDINRVSGKMRITILEDPIYKQETRGIRAQMVLKEIEDLDRITGLLNSAMDESDEEEDEEEEEEVDVRGLRKRKPPKKTVVKKPVRKIDKDFVNMQLKTSQVRRELLELDKVEEDNEDASINIFFYACTKEEFEKIDTVEVYEGDKDAELNDEEDAALPDVIKNRKGKKNDGKEQILIENEDYIVKEDGTIVEM